MRSVAPLLPALPMLLPLVTAVVGLAVRRSLPASRVVGVAGAAAGLAGSLVLAGRVAADGAVSCQVGSWPSPFGITLVADELSAVMVTVSALIGLAVAIYAVAEVDDPRHRDGFFPLMHVLLAGVQGAFLTGDLFNLYVCFEVMLMASFVLLALGGERAQLGGAMVYVTLNLVASALFLAAVGVIYGLTASLNLAELSLRLPALAAESPGLVAASGGLLLVAFGIKAGMFPFYAWLPASYHTPPVAVSAVFAGLLTKVGVYSLLRVVPLLFPDFRGLGPLLGWGAALTMVFGVLGAVAQFHVRRVLGFHIVSQIGYMVLGLALAASPDPSIRRLAVTAAVFYVAHHIVVKTNLFLIAGLIRRVGGTEELKPLGGLASATPWLALLFAVPAASLAGIPPLSGFWAKLGIIRVGLAAGAWWWVGAALAAGLLTLMSMVKIWNEAFWKPAADRSAPQGPAPMLMVVPVVALALVTVLIGLWPEPLMTFAGRAADSILDPEAYRAAVGLMSGGGG